MPECPISAAEELRRAVGMRLRTHSNTNAKSKHAFLNEPFAPVVTFVTIDDESKTSSTDPSHFLDDAVDLCNDHAFGSLSCSMTVPPTVDSDLVERAIAGLRYGAICVNVWTTAGCYFG
jgi:acyl-CoA reductase-like NAD-dependent aldehyde dehydrogenase